MAVIYFAAARLGLALLSADEGVAVFWPASGIAAGALILLGRHWRRSITFGVLTGTVAANLLGDRSLPVALAFGFCNAGEAILFAMLVDRVRAGAFRFDGIQATSGFFAAAAISTAVAAAAATATIVVAGRSDAPFRAIWMEWWAADVIGIITFAPVLIMLGEAINSRLTGREIGEGSSVLALLVLAAGLTYLVPSNEGVWWIPVPVATTFPILLWVAARCRPVFLGTGIMLVSLLIVIATTSGLGHFGNPRVPTQARIEAARITLASISFCGLMLASVFAQRLSVELALRANEERFSKLAAAAPGVILSLRAERDGTMSMPYVSPAMRSMLAIETDGSAASSEQFLARIHPEDRAMIEASIVAAQKDLQPVLSEFRYQHPDRREIWLEWHLAPARDADGTVAWHGFLHDVSWRKSIEAHVQLLMGEINHRSKNLLSVVQAVAFHTARDENPGQFVDSFNRRIAALSASHDLVTKSGWSGIELRDLIVAQLAHFSSLVGTRIRLEGPDVKLAPSAAQAIGMALHELATNASKYGALTESSGSVSIAWSCDEQLHLRWQETGGPPAVQPSQRGFGHRVVVEMCAHQLEASIALEYPPSGVVWSLSAPCERVIEVKAPVASAPYL